MLRRTESPVGEDYIQQVLSLTQRVYDRRQEEEHVAGLLDPARPLLTSLHTSLQTLVESVRQNPNQVLQRGGWGWFSTGEDIQFAMPGDNLGLGMFFCRAGFEKPWFKPIVLNRVLLIKAAPEEMEYAKTRALRDDYYLLHPCWEHDDRFLYDRQNDVETLQSGFSLAIGEDRQIARFTYYTHVFDLARVLGLPGIIPSDFEGGEHHPWTATLKIRKDQIHLEVLKGQSLFSLQTAPDGQFHGKGVRRGQRVRQFSIQTFLKNALEDFPIPLLDPKAAS